MAQKYSKVSLGCHIDGAFGTEHRRKRLCEMLEYCCPFNSTKLQMELRDEPSDDYSEEDEAVDILNRSCVNGVHFEWDSGDLLLVEDSND